MMLSRLLGSKSRDAEYWQKRLAQARHYLWEGDLKRAEALFAQLAAEVEAEPERQGDDRLQAVRLDAQLGRWAVRYLCDPQQGGLYRRLTANRAVNGDTWYFVARVFMSRGDTGEAALQAYQNLLAAQPSPKLARRIGSLAIKTPASDASLSLLRQITEILPENKEAALYLCLRYLRAGRLAEAAALANRLLTHEVSDEERAQSVDVHEQAHRCLGYIAERAGDWAAAKRHFAASGDSLRLAVVSAKDNDWEVTRQALQAIPVARHDDTWQYYAGWEAYWRGDFKQAVAHWQRLQAARPDNRHLETVLVVSRRRAAHRCLQALEPENALALLSENDASAWPEAFLRIGAVYLLLQHDPERARPHLKRAYQRQGDSVLVATFMALCEASSRNEDDLDRQFYRTLAQKCGDASLFLWLRGLLLLRDDPSKGKAYLVRAHADGVGSRYLPPAALMATAWVAHQLDEARGEGVLAGLSEKLTLDAVAQAGALEALFHWAVAPSFGFTCLQDGAEPVAWLERDRACPLTSPGSWRRVQTVYYAQRRQWRQALDAAEAEDAALQRDLVMAAIGDALQRRDWEQATSLVERGLAITPGVPQLRHLAEILSGFNHQALWQRKSYHALEAQLQAQLQRGGADTRLHHSLALVYTRLGMLADGLLNGAESEPPQPATPVEPGRDGESDRCWLGAIGHWAVVLSDDDYWEAWHRRRGPVYGEELKPERVRRLRQEAVPQALKGYHQERAGESGDDARRARHRRYVALLDSETEATAAVRYEVRAAERRQAALPPQVKALLSPTLLKVYGHETSGAALVEMLSELRLSPHEAQLARLAFSPVSDARALIEAGEYALALDRLRALARDRTQDRLQQLEVSEELARALDRYSRQLIAGEQWEKAIEISQEGCKLQPADAEMQDLLAQAVVGWANLMARNGEYGRAVERLRSTRPFLSFLRRDVADLNVALSAILLEWAGEAESNDDLDVAIRRVEEALQADANNLHARQEARRLYHNRAYTHAIGGRLDLGAKDAEQALTFMQYAATMGLLAGIKHDLAQRALESGQKRLAERYFGEAFQWASECCETEPSPENFDFAVGILRSVAVGHYRLENYAKAIRLAETLLKYGSEELESDMREFISAVYTDLGVQQANRNRLWEARQSWQTALQYDSTNSTARNNLRIVGGFY